MEFTTQKQNRTRDIILIFFIVFIGLYFRRPDAFLKPQIYAEDGPIFLQQYFELGIKSLITPYAGYLHTVPRIIALLFGSLSVNLLYIPLCYNLSYFLLSFFIAVQLWKGATYLGLRNKIFFATVFLFVPVGPEMFMNITNSIWVTSLYLVNFIFIGYKSYDSEQWKVLKLSILLIISLTGPFSLLLSPIILLIIFLERKKLTFSQLIPMGVILLGGFIQCISIKFLAPKQDRSIPGIPEPYHLLKLIKYNMGDLLFLRNSVIPELPGIVHWVVGLGGFIVLIYLLFVSYKKIEANRKYVLLLVPVVYLGSFIVVFWPMETHVLAFGCPRYYFVPYTCIVWVFIVAHDRVMKYIHIAMYFIYFLCHSRNMKYTFTDKAWRKQVLEYYDGKREQIDINPDSWHVTLPKRK
jgi:hypothetical protein